MNVKERITITLWVIYYVLVIYLLAFIFGPRGRYPNDFIAIFGAFSHIGIIYLLVQFTVWFIYKLRGIQIRLRNYWINR